MAAYGELKATEEERDRERGEHARLRSLLADQQSSAAQNLGVRSLASTSGSDVFDKILDHIYVFHSSQLRGLRLIRCCVIHTD